MKRKRKPVPPARSAIILQMLLTRKGGAHRDRKRESRRKAGRVTDDE